MREYSVKIKPFGLLHLLSVSGRQTENAHGVFRVVGVIDITKANEYLALGLRDQDAEIIALGADGNEKKRVQGHSYGFSA